METHPWAQVNALQNRDQENIAGPSGLQRPSDEAALETVKGFGSGDYDSDALTNQEKWSCLLYTSDAARRLRCRSRWSPYH